MTALYKRLDAAVFYCASKKVNFGLQAYIARVTAMQQQAPGVWEDLEDDDRADDLRNLVVDHYLASNTGSTAKRHFVVGPVQQRLGTRGQVLAAGSKEESRKRLAEDKGITLRKNVKRKMADLAKAQAELEEYLRAQEGPATSTTEAGMPAQHAVDAAVASRPGGAGACTKRGSKRSRSPAASDVSDDGEDDDNDDEHEGAPERRRDHKSRTPASGKTPVYDERSGESEDEDDD